MARTEHLPIYRASDDLCLYLEQGAHRFLRYHKYTLGTDLRDAARRALKLVVRANSQRDRVATLLALREEFEELKVLPRLGQDLKVFSGLSTFEHAVKQVIELAKQNEGRTTGPKPREVFAADFRDPIVHTCSLRIRSAYSSRCSFTMPTPAGWARARSPRATD